jgi:hypothetical protein
MLRKCEDEEAPEKLKVLETSFYKRQLLLKKLRQSLRRKVIILMYELCVRHTLTSYTNVVGRYLCTNPRNEPSEWEGIFGAETARGLGGRKCGREVDIRV